MKALIACLVLFFNYCSCQVLVGGWSTSNDESLKSSCLKIAIDYITGAKGGNEVVSEASDLVCESQVVNGLNIKCDFNFRGQEWKCSYYESLNRTISLQQCEVQDGEQTVQTLGTSTKNDGSTEASDSNEEEDKTSTLQIQTTYKSKEPTKKCRKKTKITANTN